MVDSLDRAVASLLREVVGGVPQVNEYLDEDESHRVAIFRAHERPAADCTTYSTIGLCRAPNLLDGRQIAVELAMVGLSSRQDVPNVLASCAFLMTKDRWLGAPGVVFPEVFNAYGDGGRLRHVLWVPPFPWDRLAAVEVEDRSIHWLLGIPISDGERRYLGVNGFDAGSSPTRTRRTSTLRGRPLSKTDRKATDVIPAPNAGCRVLEPLASE